MQGLMFGAHYQAGAFGLNSDYTDYTGLAQDGLYGGFY